MKKSPFKLSLIIFILLVLVLSCGATLLFVAKLLQMVQYLIVRLELPLNAAFVVNAVFLAVFDYTELVEFQRFNLGI